MKKKKRKIDVETGSTKKFWKFFTFLKYEKSTGLIDFIIDSAESFLFIWLFFYI